MTKFNERIILIATRVLIAFSEKPFCSIFHLYNESIIVFFFIIEVNDICHVGDGSNQIICC